MDALGNIFRIFQYASQFLTTKFSSFHQISKTFQNFREFSKKIILNLYKHVCISLSSISCLQQQLFWSNEFNSTEEPIISVLSVFFPSKKIISYSIFTKYPNLAQLQSNGSEIGNITFTTNTNDDIAHAMRSPQDYD